MPIEVFAADEQSEEAVDLARWSGLAERVVGDRGLGDDVELTILFVDEGAMASLNRRFLGRDGPTDVLSFPIEDDLLLQSGPPGGISPPGSGPGRHGMEDEIGETPGPGIPLLLGDVVICPAVAARNAPEHAGTYEDETALLLVHGILHLLGMDHEDETEATKMEALEQLLLDRHYRQAVP